MSTGSNLWQRFKSRFKSEPPEPRLTRDEVLRIATSYLEQNGNYRLREPYNIGIDNEKAGILWHICDSINTRGGNFHMQISDASGEIIKTWATPR